MVPTLTYSLEKEKKNPPPPRSAFVNFVKYVCVSSDIVSVFF